jgi:hypothetical protein
MGRGEEPDQARIATSSERSSPRALAADFFDNIDPYLPSTPGASCNAALDYATDVASAER